jgi:transcriptional regulator with XRE-family HTH domain
MAIRRSITGLPKNLGERIAEARQKRGLSASEFARRMQVTPTAVWNWEKNGITPRNPTLSAIAAMLKVSEEFLRSGDSNAAVAGTVAPVDKLVGFTVAESIERAKREIALAAGLPIDRVKLSVEFI